MTEEIINKIIEKFKLDSSIVFWDANQYPDNWKRISSVPFRLSTNDEEDEYKLFSSKNTNEQRGFISTGFTVFIFPDIAQNIDALKKIDNPELYPNGYNKTICIKINEIVGLVTDISRVTFAILHEIGHYYHFFEMGKKPFCYSEFYRSNNSLCEYRADEFAFEHIYEILCSLNI